MSTSLRILLILSLSTIPRHVVITSLCVTHAYSLSTASIQAVDKGMLSLAASDAHIITYNPRNKTK